MIILRTRHQLLPPLLYIGGSRNVGLGNKLRLEEYGGLRDDLRVPKPLPTRGLGERRKLPSGEWPAAANAF